MTANQINIMNDFTGMGPGRRRVDRRSVGLALGGLLLVGCGMRLGGDPGSSDGPMHEQSFTLPFAASNLPAGTNLVAPSDLIIGSENCGGTQVTIDTGTGTISGCDLPAVGYQRIEQADTSLGTIEAALFTMNRLVVETNMTVKVTGNQPLILVAAADVQIGGNLWASADGSRAVAGGASGPGAHGMGTGPGAGAILSSGGAGGGAFCGKGGDGGGAVGSGGHSYGSATLRPLIGGSSGAQVTADAGGGGGAIQIVSATSIEVAGLATISAGGGGGSWSGSGAGSGGAILLEAPTVTVAGVIAANGGGGGGADTLGQSGQNANPSAVPAGGGSSQGGVTDNGGTGSAGSNIDGAGVTMPATGGGGGGGAGRIRINTRSGVAAVSGTVSPAIDPCFSQAPLGS